jgi:hypothetical protein
MKYLLTFFKNELKYQKSKKMVVLLAAVGGSGSYAIRQNGFLQVILLAIFVFFIIGVIVNYLELNKKDLEEIEHG